MMFDAMSVKEGVSCDCGRGRFVAPNKWWKETLKMVRCTHCGREAILLPGSIHKGITALKPKKVGQRT